MSLCPEAECRATLTDAEFWEHVFHGDDGPDDYDPADDPNLPPETPLALGVPCSVCGASNVEPCGYDTEGRPWIHCTDEDES